MCLVLVQFILIVAKKQYQFKFQIGSGRYFFEVLENE